MIVLDANVFLYAYDDSSTSHAACHAWLTQALNGSEKIGLPWQTAQAFLRIATNPRIYVQPMSIQTAIDIVASWLARPQVVAISPEDRFWTIFREQLTSGRASGPLVTDAAIATIAVEQGATLCTTDRDFRRFDGVKLIDPTQLTN